MNKKKIVIEPVTRVEGHGKVTIKLDENGKLLIVLAILLMTYLLREMKRK